MTLFAIRISEVKSDLSIFEVDGEFSDTEQD